MRTPANSIIMQFSSLIRTFSIFIVARTGTTGIENGVKVYGNDYNYIVSITDMCSAEHLCGGAIIDELHILTAAHCVHHRSPENLIILAGSKVLIDPQTITRRVIEIHIHEKYDPSSNPSRNVSRRDSHLMYEGNDIAVLTVEFPYTWKERIGSIRLPGINDEKLRYCLAAGWGRNQLGKELQSQFMYISDANMCYDREAYHGLDEFCAVNVWSGGVFFPDDHGDPLEDVGYLAGIVVSTSDKGSQAPVFTDVLYHRGFIKKIMNP